MLMFYYYINFTKFNVLQNLGKGAHFNFFSLTQHVSVIITERSYVLYSAGNRQEESAEPHAPHPPPPK